MYKKVFNSFLIIIMLFSVLFLNGCQKAGHIHSDEGKGSADTDMHFAESVEKNTEFDDIEKNVLVEEEPSDVKNKQRGQSPLLLKNYVTLSVNCKTILNNMDIFNTDKLDVLPEEGIIFSEQKVGLLEGDSAFDILHREMQKNKIHMDFTATPVYNSNYIQGINNIYEFDCGPLSGWMFKVNGESLNYGVSQYEPKTGDKIEIIYTCDLGNDIVENELTTGGNE